MKRLRVSENWQVPATTTQQEVLWMPVIMRAKYVQELQFVQKMTGQTTYWRMCDYFCNATLVCPTQPCGRDIVLDSICHSGHASVWSGDFDSQSIDENKILFCHWYFPVFSLFVGSVAVFNRKSAVSRAFRFHPLAERKVLFTIFEYLIGEKKK